MIGAECQARFRRRHIAKPPQVRPASATAQEPGSGTGTINSSDKPYMEPSFVLNLKSDAIQPSTVLDEVP